MEATIIEVPLLTSMEEEDPGFICILIVLVADFEQGTYSSKVAKV
jgi:hypothetical protein